MIQIIDGFNLQTSTPIDSRIVVADDVKRLAITSTYHGLRVWEQDTNTPYFWDGVTWVSELDLVVTGDGTTNFIPKFKSSSPTEIEDSQISDDGNLVTIDKNLTVSDELTFGTLIGDLNADNITSGSLNLERIYTTGANVNDVLRLDYDGSNLVAKWTDITGIVIGTSNVTEQVNLTKVTTTDRYSFIIRDIKDNLVGTKTNMGLYTYETDLIISENSSKMCILAHGGSKENPPYSFYDTALPTLSTPTITGGMYHTGDKLILSNRDSLNDLVDKLVIDKKAVTFGSYGDYSPRIRTHQDPTNSAEPSYTWWGNDTTGMYRPSNNAIGFCVGGGVSGVGNPILKIDLNGVHINSSYATDDFVNVNTIGVPIGGIVMYTGNVNNIGNDDLWNFVECKGFPLSYLGSLTDPDGNVINLDLTQPIYQAGGNFPQGSTVPGPQTPDMRDRFPLGSSYGSSTNGQSGGDDKITDEHLPNHTHDSGNYSITSSGSHTHTWTNGAPVPSGSDEETGEGTADSRVRNENVSTDISNSGTHTHPSSNFTGNSGDGEFSNDDFLPPFIRVTYIMRVV